jgi:translocation protein SEC63
VFLIYYVKTSHVTMDRFDPFEILQVSETATDAEIKRAYRKLSLIYHPDKNPDPEAADYFAEKVTKAYKALTDEAAKENFIKYGHPDGRQAVSISVALPEWFFNKDKEAAPAILLTLLFGGIVFPLGMAAWYMKKSKKSVGLDEVMPETQQLYMFGPFNIKQAQGVGKIAETLCCALEFINLQLGKDDGPALMNELRPEIYPYHQEVGDVQNSSFYKKRPTGMVKANLLLYGHMCRVPIPAVLKKDFEFVMKKTPRLIQELFMLSSSVPRVKPNYGWAAPSIGAVEFMQCMIRAVPVEAKKHFPAPIKSRQGPPTILQLPHITHEMCLKDLMKRNIKSLSDFLQMEDATAMSELANLGLNKKQVEDIMVAIHSFPALTMSARAFIDDEEFKDADDFSFMSMTDIVTVQVNAFLSRRAHMDDSFDADSLDGKNVRAYAPNYPYPKDEYWIFMIVNSKDNAILAHTRVSLVEAEKNGALNKEQITEMENPEDIVRLVNEHGQQIRMQFLAPPPGKHNLSLIAMCDSWIGADYGLALPLTSVEPTRAQREGRAPRAAPKKNLERSEESEQMIEEDNSDGEIVPDEDEEDEEEEDEGLWDSDEYGTEESGSDSEHEDNES